MGLSGITMLLSAPRNMIFKLKWNLTYVSIALGFLCLLSSSVKMRIISFCLFLFFKCFSILPIVSTVVGLQPSSFPLHDSLLFFFFFLQIPGVCSPPDLPDPGEVPCHCFPLQQFAPQQTSDLGTFSNFQIFSNTEKQTV